MAVPTLKSFVSEKEIEEVKKKRQEEWEKVRRPDQPLQRPEEEYDHRTLYEKLKQQKDLKEEEWQEQHKFKNMIYKGLDDEESVFLTFVADRRAEHEDELIREEIKEVCAYREAVAQLQEEKLASPSSENPQSAVSPTGNSNDPPPKSSRTGSTGGGGQVKPKSQLSLIAGSIKTKRKRNSSRDEGSAERAQPAADMNISSPKKQKFDSQSEAKSSLPQEKVSTSAAQEARTSTTVATAQALPGLAAYSSSDSSEEED